MGKTILQTYFSIESKGSTKISQEIANYPHENQDFCDAQSARSDSCVSEDEYLEVYRFLKIKKKPKENKKPAASKPKSNAYIKTHKYHTS